MERILFRFTKEDPVRYVGHLDLMRVVERAMRRSGFPILYSQGFNPRPRMSFASALTLGATSEWELCQLDLAEDLSPEALEAAVAGLQQQLPPGIRILGRWGIPLERRNPYIQVTAAAYELTLSGEDAGRRMSQFLQEGPGIPQALECAVELQADPVLLKVTLPVGERGGVRIRDLIAELEKALPGLRVPRLHRARLWCELEPATLQDQTDNGKCDEAVERVSPAVAGTEGTEGQEAIAGTGATREPASSSC